MNVSITEIFGRAFSLVWKNRVFWLLGLLITLTTAGLPITNSFSTPTYTPSTSGSTVPSYDSSGLGLSLLLTCVNALLILGLFLFVRPALEAGLIAGTARADNDAAPTLREAWQEGRVSMWRVLGLTLIQIGVGIVFGLVIFVISFCALGAMTASIFAGISSTLSNPSTPYTPSDPTAGMAGFFVGIAVVGLIYLAVAVVLGGIVELGKRAIVLEGYQVGQAWSKGWALLKSNLGRVLLVILGQFLIGLVLSIPVFAISFSAGLYNFSGIANGTSTVSNSILLGLVIWLLTVAINSLPGAWYSTIWTLLYRAISPAPAVVPGGGFYGGPGSYSQGGNYPYYGGQQPGGYGQPQDYGQQQPGGYSVPGQYPEYGRYGGPEQPTSGEPPQPGGYSTPGQYPGGFRIPDGPTSETGDPNQPKPETDKPEA